MKSPAAARKGTEVSGEERQSDQRTKSLFFGGYILVDSNIISICIGARAGLVLQILRQRCVRGRRIIFQQTYGYAAELVYRNHVVEERARTVTPLILRVVVGS
jgi:hypothetical protein